MQQFDGGCSEGIPLRPEQPQALYRFFNWHGELLYVGITLDPGSRFKAHRKDKPWWTQVNSITLEHFPDRASVERAEIEAIKAEKPIHNVAHNQRDTFSAAKIALIAADYERLSELSTEELEACVMEQRLYLAYSSSDKKARSTEKWLIRELARRERQPTVA